MRHYKPRVHRDPGREPRPNGTRGGWACARITCHLASRSRCGSLPGEVMYEPENPWSDARTVATPAGDVAGDDQPPRTRVRGLDPGGHRRAEAILPDRKRSF